MRLNPRFVLRTTFILALLGTLACSSRSAAPAIAFADSAAYRKLKNDIIAFHEVDVDENGFPDGFIFSKEKSGFVPILYVQSPKGETTQWARVCIGEPLEGDRFEKLRFVRDGDAERLLAIATEEDPDRLTVDFAIYDPKRPCEPLLRAQERFEKPLGDVVSPGTIRIGLQVSADGNLIIVDSPATTRMRGRNGVLDMLTAVTVRRWMGSASIESERWSSVRKSLLKRVEVDVQWRRGAASAPDVLVGDYGNGDAPSAAMEPNSNARGNGADANATAPARFDPAILADDSMQDAWTLKSGEVGTVELRARDPFVLLEVRHGCTLGEPGPLELTSANGPSLYVTGTRPVANGVFTGSASGRQRAGEPAVELGALKEPTTQLSLALGPEERVRCLRAVRAYGWTIPAPARVAAGENASESSAPAESSRQ
ncbi:MAG: hypothetical protein AAF658_11180 [Myxococcota bacterium]